MTRTRQRRHIQSADAIHRAPSSHPTAWCAGMRRPGLNYDQSSPLAGVGSLLLRAAGTVGYPLGVRLSTLKTPLTRRTVQAQLFGERCFERLARVRLRSEY